MPATEQLLQRALHLARRRTEFMTRIHKQAATADAQIARMTASLTMAVEALVMAYQEEARNSPWYIFPAIKREAAVEAANAPHKKALSAARQGRDIIKDAKEVLDGKIPNDVLNAGILLVSAASVAMGGRAKIDWDMFEDPGQRIANRLRQLQYDLLNEGLPLIALAHDAGPIGDTTELLLANGDDGGQGAHSAWVERWYDGVTQDGLDLPQVIAALQAWLPLIDGRAESHETSLAEAHALALEARTLATAVDRLPPELRSFAKT